MTKTLLVKLPTEHHSCPYMQLWREKYKAAGEHRFLLKKNRGLILSGSHTLNGQQVAPADLSEIESVTHSEFLHFKFYEQIFIQQTLLQCSLQYTLSTDSVVQEEPAGRCLCSRAHGSFFAGFELANFYISALIFSHYTTTQICLQKGTFEKNDYQTIQSISGKSDVCN